MVTLIVKLYTYVYCLFCWYLFSDLSLYGDHNVDLDEWTLIWSIDRMTVDRGYPKYSEREKPVPRQLCPLHIPHGLRWDQILGFRGEKPQSGIGTG